MRSQMMRFVLILIFGILSQVASKTDTKALTESMGQEVIEIGAPIKELPPELEEEPSAEADDDKRTSTTLQAATARISGKESTSESRRRLKEISNIDNVKQDDDEARIEKELAEMYKDTDYKSDSGEAVKENKKIVKLINNTDKPIARIRNNFVFHPDKYNAKEVERFRTSVDDISCGKNKLAGEDEVTTHSGGYVPALCRMLFWGFLVLI